MNDLRNSLKILLQEIDQSLGNIDKQSFSRDAFNLLKQKILEYASHLIIESTKTANRHRADSISSSHVEKASEYLVVGSTNKLLTHLGTVGGIFLGAGISNLLSMITTSQFSMYGIVGTVGLSIIGSFLTAIHMARS